jgi:hypothetical protein
MSSSTPSDQPDHVSAMVSPNGSQSIMNTFDGFDQLASSNANFNPLKSSSSSVSTAGQGSVTVASEMKHRLMLLQKSLNPDMNSMISRNNVTTANTVPPQKIAPQKLKYDIHSWSSYSANYHPRNIMLNKPMDQSSRWSSGSNNQNQFIMVKLDKVSIVRE